VLQLMTQNDIATTEAQYLEVIHGKTAALFAAAARLGAVVANRPAAEEEALDAFGRNLGVAFQLVDDALDYGGVAARLGKNVGDDFREGKITLPVVLSFRRGNAAERTFWQRTLAQGDVRDGDLEQAKAIMKKHRALDDTIERARHYGAMALDALAPWL
jgi:octaprenyl-diphosphate synthase